MLSSFEKLFGIPKNRVKSLCILTPFLTKPFNEHWSIKEFYKGKPYTSAYHDKFTLIETRIGPAFTGDAILALKDSPCERILFIGACGALDRTHYPIGSIVIPTSCYAMESFSHLTGDQASFTHNIPAPQNSLSVLLAKHALPVQCASLGSIQLQGALKDQMHENHVDIVEMECASVFSAGMAVDIASACLLYVTDIIGETCPYDPSDPESASAIQTTQMNIAKIIDQI